MEKIGRESDGGVRMDTQTQTQTHRRKKSRATGRNGTVLYNAFIVFFPPPGHVRTRKRLIY